MSERRSGEADEPENPDERGSGFLPDLLRRAMVMGFSGFFTTESAVRRALGETVSPDLVDFAAEQGERARQDLLERITREVGRVLEKVDVADVMRKVLEGRTVEVTARIRLVEPDDDTKPAGRGESPRAPRSSQTGSEPRPQPAAHSSTSYPSGSAK